MRPLLKYFMTLLAALSLSTCGSNTIRIDVDLPVNQTSPFVTLIAGPNPGIFFQFDRLVSNPGSIDDTDGSTAIFFPDDEPPFLEPNNESFDISAVGLDETRAYRVKMFGTLDSTPPADFEGVGDCPLHPALGNSNIIHVCFGATSPTPLCTDTLPFSLCPK